MRDSDATPKPSIIVEWTVALVLFMLHAVTAEVSMATNTVEARLDRQLAIRRTEECGFEAHWI